jgi:hypothetical protein
MPSLCVSCYKILFRMSIVHDDTNVQTFFPVQGNSVNFMWCVVVSLQWQFTFEGVWLYGILWEGPICKMKACKIKGIFLAIHWSLPSTIVFMQQLSNWMAIMIRHVILLKLFQMFALLIEIAFRHFMGCVQTFQTVQWLSHYQIHVVRADPYTQTHTHTHTQ